MSSTTRDLTTPENAQLLSNAMSGFRRNEVVRNQRPPRPIDGQNKRQEQERLSGTIYVDWLSRLKGIVRGYTSRPISLYLLFEFAS